MCRKSNHHKWQEKEKRKYFSLNEEVWAIDREISLSFSSEHIPMAKESFLLASVAKEILKKIFSLILTTIPHLSETRD